jgi:hypothetical protein
LTELTYQLAGFKIFDMAEVETPSCPATSAKAIPCVFTSQIAIRARTLLASLRRLPPFNSSIDTSLKEVLLIEQDVFGDRRGYFMETYQKKCSAFYDPGSEGGILWSNPAIGIDLSLLLSAFFAFALISLNTEL